MRHLRRLALSAALLCSLAGVLDSGWRPLPGAGVDAEARERPVTSPPEVGSRRGAWLRPAPGAERELAARAVALGRRRQALARAARRVLEGAEAPARETPGAAAGLHLDRPALAESALAVRMHGFDPLAPRPVWLWRVGPDAAALAARGHSRADGELVFPRLAIPAGGLRLVATPAGRGPDAPGASALAEVPGRPPRPARGWWPDATDPELGEATFEEGEDNHADGNADWDVE